MGLEGYEEEEYIHGQQGEYRGEHVEGEEGKGGSMMMGHEQHLVGEYNHEDEEGWCQVAGTYLGYPTPRTCTSIPTTCRLPNT